jgi:hypothetical protein
MQLFLCLNEFCGRGRPRRESCVHRVVASIRSRAVRQIRYLMAKRRRQRQRGFKVSFFSPSVAGSSGVRHHCLRFLLGLVKGEGRELGTEYALRYESSS